MFRAYNKEFDAAMAQLYSKLKSIKSSDGSIDPVAKESIDLLDKIGLDVTYTESGLAMEAAINHARETLKNIYSKAIMLGNLGIMTMVENAVRGDPFFHDVVEDERKE